MSDEWRIGINVILVNNGLDGSGNLISNIVNFINDAVIESN